MARLYIDFHDAGINRMAVASIDFHDAVINRMVVASDFKLNQFITWNGDNYFCVYEFSNNQQVFQVDRFTIKNGCHQYDAIDHGKQYFHDTHNFRVSA